MVRFASETDLLDRLRGELREGSGRLCFLIGPDLAPSAAPWPDAVLAVADEYARQRHNDDLLRVLQTARRAADPTGRYAGYRNAFADWLGPEAFDVVIQRSILEAYQPPEDDGVAIDLSPARPLDFHTARVLELDSPSWELSQGVTAFGLLAAHFADRLDRRVLTTTLGPAISVALRRAGVEGDILTPLTHPSLMPPSSDPTAVHVVHLHGYWRPLSAGDRAAPVLDPRRPGLSREVRTRVAALFADRTVCVLGYAGDDPIVMDALQLAAARRTRVLWAVPDPHADRSPRIRVLADRAGGGDSVTIHVGVDGDRLLRELAAQMALTPLEQVPVGPRVVLAASAPKARLFPQPDMARAAGAVPLREPAEGAVDLLRQLRLRFDWRLEPLAASPAPTLLFWPVRLRKPSLIHMVQAVVAAALSAHGVRVVLALDDFGDFTAATRNAFEQRVTEWFGRIPESQRPDFVSLQDWIEDRELNLGRMRDERAMSRPTTPWAVLQEYYGRLKPSPYSVLRAAKIIPDVEPEDAMAHAAIILDSLRERGAQRLLTAPAIWSLFNHILLDRQIGDLITLAGEDERTLWRHRREVIDEPTRHLYHPKIANLSQDSGMIRWEHHDDLRVRIENAVGTQDWRRPDRYVPWIVRHAFLLPEYLRTGTGAKLGNYSLDAWQDVLTALEGSPEVADLLSRRISSWFLGDED
ncbi:MAG TPA: hypothetical protein VF657_11410 [Actinoplanes sp.]